MSTDADRRRELADFFRARREQFTRSELGLPARGRGRIAGLRREEVAFLAGVSVTWYTWLEQAREIRPSRQVLEAIVRTLRLSVRERIYVLELAGYSSASMGSPAIVRDAPSHVHRLLDALADYPAYAIAPDWASPVGTRPMRPCTRTSRWCRLSTVTCCGWCSPTPTSASSYPTGRPTAAISSPSSGPKPAPDSATPTSRTSSAACLMRAWRSARGGRATASSRSPHVSGGFTIRSSVLCSSNTTGWHPRIIRICMSSSTPPSTPRPHPDFASSSIADRQAASDRHAMLAPWPLVPPLLGAGTSSQPIGERPG